MSLDVWSLEESFLNNLPIFSKGAFDSTVHLSEEATNASVAVPWAIVYATGSGCVLGWGKYYAVSRCVVILTKFS